MTGNVTRRELLHMGALLSTAALAAACTPAAPPPAATPAPVEETSGPAGPTAVPAGPGEIVLQHWQSDWGKDWNDPMLTLSDSFSKDVMPNVKMEWTFMPGVSEKLLAGVAGGNAPDICTIDEGYGVPKMARAGGLMSLEEYYKRDGIKGEDFIAFTWATVLYKNVPYGIPGGAGTQIVIYNKAAFRDAGLDPELPDTPKMSDFWDWVQKLVKKDDSGKITRIGYNAGAWGYFNAWAGLLGVKLYNDDLTQLIVDSAENVQALETYVKLLPEGVPYDDISNLLAGAPTSSYGSLGAGMEALITEGYWFFLAADKYWPELDYGMCKLPTPNGSKDEWHLFSGWVWDPTIPKGAKHPDEAWAFLKYGYWEHGEMLADTINWTSSLKCFPEFEKRTRKIMGEGNRELPYLHHFSEAQYAAKYFFPYTPIFQQLNDTLSQEVDQVLRGQKSGAEALASAKAAMQPELDKVNAEGW